MTTRKMFTVTFVADAAERAVRTAAQTLLTGTFLSNTGPVNAFELDYRLGLGLAAGGVVTSLLTSIVSAPIGESDTASVLPSPPAPPPES